MERPRIWLGLAALIGLTAVAAGAFAAHGIDDPEAQDWLRTGALYGLTHALAVFAAAGQSGRAARLAQALFVIGAAIFSGTLFAMALGAPTILGAVTPIGGLGLMAGWACLAVAGFRRSSSAQDRPPRG